MEEGILAPVARLDRWLDAVLVALLVTCSVRYLLRHDLDATALLVLAGAVVLGAAYLTRRLVADRPPWPTVWVARRRRALGDADPRRPVLRLDGGARRLRGAAGAPLPVCRGRRRRHDRGRQRGVEPHHRRPRPDGLRRPGRHRPRDGALLPRPGTRGPHAPGTPRRADRGAGGSRCSAAALGCSRRADETLTRDPRLGRARACRASTSCSTRQSRTGTADRRRPASTSPPLG